MPDPRPELVDRFVCAYDALDDLMRSRLERPRGEPHSSLLSAYSESNRVVKAHLSTLRRFADLRNLLQHDTDRRRWRAIAVPDIRAVEFYEQVVHDVRHEPTVHDRCVPRGKVFIAALGDKVVDVMKTMAVRGYSQAPVLDKDVVVGVFSESTPFAMVASSSEVLIESSMTVADCRDFLQLDRQVNESFCFVAKASAWSTVEDLFSSNRREARRLGAVFVTEHGKPSEKLLGLVTAWDLA